MRNLNFISMRGTDLVGGIIEQKKIPGKGIIYVVQKCGRIHAVLNGVAVADSPEGSGVADLVKKAEVEI